MGELQLLQELQKVKTNAERELRACSTEAKTTTEQLHGAIDELETQCDTQLKVAEREKCDLRHQLQKLTAERETETEGHKAQMKAETEEHKAQMEVMERSLRSFEQDMLNQLQQAEHMAHTAGTLNAQLDMKKDLQVALHQTENELEVSRNFGLAMQIRLCSSQSNCRTLIKKSAFRGFQFKFARSKAAKVLCLLLL